MATLKEIIYTIRNMRYDYHVPDDFVISDKRLKHFVNVERSFLLKQYLDRDRLIPKTVEQSLNCVPLECIDISSCADCGLVADETILRTAVDIPNPLNFNFATDSATELFTFVGLPTGKPIEFTSESIAYWGQHSKYTKNVPRAYYRNKRIYFRNLNGVEFVNIKGIFENPEELTNLYDCSGNTCYDEESQYPILDHHLSIIYQTIFQKYIVPAIQLPHDKNNDATEIKN